MHLWVSGPLGPEMGAAVLCPCGRHLLQSLLPEVGTVVTNPRPPHTPPGLPAPFLQTWKALSLATPPCPLCSDHTRQPCFQWCYILTTSLRLCSHHLSSEKSSLTPVKSTSSFMLSSHTLASLELLQSSCSPLGTPTEPCYAIPESALNTQICHCNRGHLWLEDWLDGGALSSDGSFPLFPTLLAKYPFPSADSLLSGPGR